MNLSLRWLLCIGISLSFNLAIAQQDIPLPEHPRPDFRRDLWENLNGPWAFRFDGEDAGQENDWHNGAVPFDHQIQVPFPWGSDLSGVTDEADIGWYKRDIKVDESWNGKRVFLTIGASDWKTTVWLDGHLIGHHEGGYVPFSLELTDFVKFDQVQKLVIRVDDARRYFTLYGKQGYGNARGIWQTIYLEARANDHLDALHFTPNIDNSTVMVTAYVAQAAPKDLALEVLITSEQGATITGAGTISKGKLKTTIEIEISEPILWDLENPHLYNATATLASDEVHGYFGMRKISVVNLPGTDYPYIALNNKPIYLQLALDQSYHPEGFYTFPSDQFIKEEIIRSKSIGLNGIRTHIKVEVPRKLYWADKLGLLIMEDLPNSWGEPDALMQEESEYTLRAMIKRDYNHPSIFSWVVFNETWGLFTNTGKDENGKDIRTYLPETQHWVASMYYLAKSLDQSRLVEDNSICCGRGHTETDINSWHVYLPGWEWDDYLSNLTEQTYEGSTFDFEDGFVQGRQPNINSECGNVWGYSGSTGDIDWSWDYHRMLNTFRMYPKVGGWLYTEHHDVINEWNGYWRYDRTEKETGMGELMHGMTLSDLHSPVYLSTGNEICKTVKGGEQVEVPLYLSVMTGDDLGQELHIDYQLEITDHTGHVHLQPGQQVSAPYSAWGQTKLPPLQLNIPKISGLAILKLTTKDEKGEVLHHNFMHFEIIHDGALEGSIVCGVHPGEFVNAAWSKKQWDVLDGKKVNGAGSGYFEYDIPISDKINMRSVAEAYVIVEASAKELFVKDQQDFDRNQDYMKGSVVAPSSNPNSYPMTDEVYHPSDIIVDIQGQPAYHQTLPDDPADHRGVLSWHHQLKDRKLREAGSYGYLIKVPIKKSVLRKAIRKGKLTVRLATDRANGLAIYGKEFGRYPVDPSVIIVSKK